MSANTSIEWTTTRRWNPETGVLALFPGYTFNPWSGCAKISPGCANCYAAALPPGMRRGAVWGENGTRPEASDDYWRQPLAWAAKARKLGVRLKVFCASTADVFEDRAELDPLRDRLFALIALTPELDWLLLTKRPEVAVRYFAGMPRGAIDRAGDHFGRAIRINNPNDPAFYPQLRIGVSVEDQAATARIAPLLSLGCKTFLSCEPLLGPVDLRRVPWPGCGHTDADGQPDCHDNTYNALTGNDSCSHGYWGGGRSARIGWVIAGGESGHRARPMHPDWARSLRDQCAGAGVPFLFKQWGEWAPWFNEEHFTRGADERYAHAWLDADTGKGGAAWITDGDSLWSNWTGEPRRAVQPIREEQFGCVADLHPAVAVMGRHGKHAAGRLLDGVTHDGFPS